MIVASIPSPSSGTLELGPLNLHAYGVCIALGVLAAAWLSSRLWKERGGKTEDITAIITWAVPAGIVGSRIYHVITDFEIYRHNPAQALAIWDGGLGIWGGVAGGVAVGILVARRRGLDWVALLDIAAPSIALAQAVGRWGNYFNQELFGSPSTLPWAIQISPDNRPSETLDAATYHPTFLYESLWNLLLCAGLVYLYKRLHLRRGSLFAAYVAGYTFIRFFIEQMRVDFAHTIAGVRVNVWVALVCFVAAATYFYIREHDHDPRVSLAAEDRHPADEPEAAEPQNTP